ncbi:MAG: radical SAM protein [Nitrospirae bacterium]|nr:MAG: radical SAM protein [Nitrospirota bacterium]
MFFKRRPLHLTLFVTNRCNARCRFCFYETNRPCNEMDLNEYRALAENLWGLLWLSFSGGEVFLREDISDIASVFYERCRPSFVLISTNGTLPERVQEQTEKVLMSCPTSTVVLKVSIDGVGPEHDRLRGIDGAFDRALETIKLLGRLRKRFSNLQIGVNTVLCSKNINNIEETISFVKTLPEVQVHTLSLVRGRGYGEYGINWKEYHQKIRNLYHYSPKTCYSFKGAKLKAAQDRLQSRFIEMLLRGERPPQ